MNEVILAHLVGGRRIPAPTEFTHENPVDRDDLHVSIPGRGVDLVVEAVAIARKAQLGLAALGAEGRSDMLARMANRVEARAESLAQLVTRETGKTITDAHAEVKRTVRILRFYSGEALRNVGECFESVRVGLTVEVVGEPVGVVGIITPWNFPLAIPVWKIAPALAFANAIVWKPSEMSSAVASDLADILVANCPVEGAVNLVLGDGQTGAALIEHGVDAVSFTGSAAVGERVRISAAERGAVVQTELGGVNGLVIANDADLDLAVECATQGAFFAAGQRCTSTSRVIVHAGVANAFLAALQARAASLTVGDPRDAATDIGPLVGLLQKQRVVEQMMAVEAGGAHAVFGGASLDAEGCYVRPTLYRDASRDSLVAREEIFGPVAGFFEVACYEEAVATLNEPRCNLSAAIVTRSLHLASDFKRRAHAGVVMVNCPTVGIDYHAPFGGAGAASYGQRELGRSARAFYTRSKTCYQRVIAVNESV